VIAVEVHQSNPQSSDLSFDLELAPGFVPALEQLEAVGIGEVAATLGIGAPPSLWLRGTHAIRRGTFAEAKDALQEAWKLDPENIEIAVNLGYVHFRLDDLEMAEAVFARGVAAAERQGVKHTILEQNLEFVRWKLP